MGTLSPTSASDWRAETTTLTRRAVDLCRQAWDIDVTLSPLVSERDLIFKVDTTDGRCFCLRLADPAVPGSTDDMQTQAMLHIAAHDPTLPVPLLVPDLHGRVAFRPNWPMPVPPVVRLMRWLDGAMIVHAPRSKAQAYAMGETLGRLARCLVDFDHRGADYYLNWDLKNAADSRGIVPAITDADLRRMVGEALDRFAAATLPKLTNVRHQIIHADLTPFNGLVATDDPDTVTGILDFGDMVRTALACDVAVAATYLLADGATPMERPAALLRGYHAEHPLTPDEIALIVPLMEARAAIAVAIPARHAACRPEERANILKNVGTASTSLRILSERSHAAWTEDLLNFCRLEPFYAAS
jgi:hydroxylysine kinase